MTTPNNILELELLDKQIETIKNNPEYQRLLISQRGLKDDQRFKAYTLKLNTLLLKRDKIPVEKENNYNPNGRIIKSLKKPETIERLPELNHPISEPKQTENFLGNNLSIRDSIQRTIRGYKKPAPKPGVTKATENVPLKRSIIPRTIRTEVSFIVPKPEPEPAELMIKASRTSIKPEFVPVSKLPEIKAAKLLKTYRRLGPPVEVINYKGESKQKAVSNYDKQIIKQHKNQTTNNDTQNEQINKQINDENEIKEPAVSRLKIRKPDEQIKEEPKIEEPKIHRPEIKPKNNKNGKIITKNIRSANTEKIENQNEKKKIKNIDNIMLDELDAENIEELLNLDF